MRILNVVQGSEEWNLVRARYNTASEAPAMMGASKNVKRNELLHMKATGSEREFSDWVQRNLLDKGHEYEAAARPHVEAMIQDDLYPATAVDDDEYLLASFDGITMTEDVLFEHKMWNADLADQVRAGELDPHYYWQLEQQLYVSGAEKVIFVTSDGTTDNFASMEYYPVDGRREALLAGWRQFDADRANYQHIEDKPAPEGKAPETLPALLIEVTGMVTSSNLVAFKNHATSVIAGIKTDLQDDADFADAEKTVKWCGDVESRLEAAKQHALSQTSSIDELFRTIDAIKADTRAKRLELERLVKARKEAIRTELVMGGQRAIGAYLMETNSALGKNYVRPPDSDIPGAMRGLKTISSLRNAVDTTVAAAKIAIDHQAAKVRENLGIMRELVAPELAYLFQDATVLISSKAADDLTNTVVLRLAEHKQAEAKRLEEERERIRQEESARLENTSALNQEVPTVSTPAPDRASLIAISHATPKPASDGKTVKLGEISTMLGFTLTADFLASVGFHPHSTERAAKLYLESSVPLICEALIRHIRGVHAQWETKAAA